MAMQHTQIHSLGTFIACGLLVSTIAPFLIVEGTVVDIPDDVLHLLQRGSDSDINWCSYFPYLPRCTNASDDQVLADVQAALLRQNAEFNWCKWFWFLPMCKTTTTRTTKTTHSTTAHHTTQTPAGPTTQTTHGHITTKHYTTGMTTTSGVANHTTNGHTTKTRYTTGMTTTSGDANHTRPTHAHISTTTERPVSGQTTAPSRLTTAEPTHSPTVKPTPPNKFSVLWFFVGFLTMLAIVVIAVILYLIIKKYCLHRSGAAGYSQISA